MKELFAGALAGTVAAVPMTAVMELLHQSFPEERQRPLPPERITMNAAEAIGIREYFDEEQARLGATLIAHFGYAAATGAAYALIAPRPQNHSTSVNALFSGALFGVGVWTVSYLGWVPAAGLLTSATKHPARRNFLMIASHVVWGATLGLTFKRLARR